MGVGKNSKKAGKQQKRLMLRRRLRVERLAERRVLATVTGLVFEDANLSFRQDAQESTLNNRLVYLDLNTNGTIDTGEPFAQSIDGSFAIPNVSDGVYDLRLYNGTDSQKQVFPTTATSISQTVSVVNGFDVASAGDEIVVATDQGVQIPDFALGTAKSLSVGANLTDIETLPDGNIVVLGEQNFETAWLVNPDTEEVTPIQELSGGIVWSEMAIDGNGQGVVLSRDASDSRVRTIDFSDATDGIRVVTTLHSIPSDAQVITSTTGPRSIFAWPGPQGLELTIWSNPTGTWIAETPVAVPDTVELLDYDDDSGLLVLRTDDGVSIHDVDGNFATIQTLPGVSGPVVLDGQRDLLLAAAASEVQIFDVRRGELLASVDVDLSTVGDLRALDYDGTQRSLVVLGSVGAATLSLSAPAAHRITVIDDQDPDPVQFGLELLDDNNGPRYETKPEFTTDEDTQLVVHAPGVLDGVIDPDGDSFVALLAARPLRGTATVGIDGSLNYLPNTDFFGTDLFSVIAHDGRDTSGEVILQVMVNPTPDAPSDVVTGEVAPLPENARPGHRVGPIDVIDVDLNDNHQFLLSDDRFVVNDGQIIYIGGGLDFETEPEIILSIIVSDPDTSSESSTDVLIRVADADDPITDIQLTDPTVEENDPGAFISGVDVEDEDTTDDLTLTVDDERFIIIGTRLWLAEGQSLDYEKESVVVINITATDRESSFTKEVEIKVGNEAEQPTEITLSNQTVMELAPGDVVGEVGIDGNPAADSYTVVVSDQRFEIVDATLKLVDDQWVERSKQEEIQLTLTVQDVGNAFPPLSQDFVIEVTENPSPYHNENSPFDVDGNGRVTAADALAIINYLNVYGPGPVGFGDPGYGYDVNNDGFVTALDALLILNELNRIQITEDNGTVNGESDEEDPEGEDPPVDQIAPLRPQDLILPQRIADAELRQPVPEIQWTPESSAPGENAGSADNNRAAATNFDFAESSQNDRERASSDEYVRGVDETLRTLSDRIS